MFADISLRVKDILRADHAESIEDVYALIRYFKHGSTITLDFSGIDWIGDEFARELFITWHNDNKVSLLNVINASDTVVNTIERILKTR